MSRYEKIEESLAKTAKISNLKTLTSKINALDQNIELISNRLNQLELKYNEKIKKKNEQVMSKSANKNYLDEAYKQLNNHKGLVSEQKAQALMQESYQKRFNILLHGLEESDKSVWETREETLKKIQNFIRERLNIMQPPEIAIADFHRFPQQLVFKNGKKINRPIIIKVGNSSDKYFIFSSLKKFKTKQ